MLPWKFRNSAGARKMAQIWSVFEAKVAVFQAEKVMGANERQWKFMEWERKLDISIWLS